MEIYDLKNKIDLNNLAHDMGQLMRKLFPVCRSITGNGFRKTLSIIQEYIPLSVHEVSSGTKVFDWVVPKEWNINDAYVKNSSGAKVIDFQNSNLHVVSYSAPIHDKVSLSELRKHIHTLPDHPDWIPYRTSYYNENWGFCMSHRKYEELQDDTYEVYIDSTLENGHLSYGEYYIKGETSDEILLSCHICHPSLCNDNLSGAVLVTFLGKFLSSLSLRYSYRIIFIPSTIGAITWLSVNQSNLSRIKHGFVVACVGDSGKFTYKRSRIGTAEIDKSVENVLKNCGDDYEVIDFSPYGYDERQYCSPGFNLPIGCLHRTSYSQYPEYHTSADNLDFVKPENVTDSFSKYLSVLNTLEYNKFYYNTNAKCEPQLGKRGLYTAIGGKSDAIVDQMALLWVLNLSDGEHSLLDIAIKSGLKFDLIKTAVDLLLDKGLLRDCVNKVQSRNLEKEKS